jgi:hypothetical protein
LLSSLSLYYPPTKVQVNQESLKLKGTFQIVVYVDDVNILGARVNTIKKNV